MKRHLFSYLIVLSVYLCVANGFCSEPPLPEPVQVSENQVKEIASLPEVAKVEFLKSINLFKITLKNGSNLWLKPTSSDAEEIWFQMSALGGFASVVKNDPLIGELSVQLARESGLDGMSGEQFSSFLYEQSIEFEPKIESFSRMIYAEVELQSLDVLMQTVERLFSKQRFTPEGWREALVLTRESIVKLLDDDEYLYQEAFLSANTQNSPIFAKVRLDDLKMADFERSKHLFLQSFADPGQFVCVVVGSFDPVKVARIASGRLGKIPKAAQMNSFEKPDPIFFPKGITHRSIKTEIGQGLLTHLTFPLKLEIKEDNIHELAFACQIIEANLRRVITEKMNISYGVDVSYEFPLFPYLESPWMSIRFGSDGRLLNQMIAIIMAELKRLQTDGATGKEMDTMKKLEAGSQEYWLQDDSYWGTMLTNYYLWGWDPVGIDYKNTPLTGYSKDQLNYFLKRFISLDNYGVFTAHP